MPFGKDTDPREAQKKSVISRNENTKLKNQTELYADTILDGGAGFKILETLLLEAKRKGDLATLRWAYELIEGKAMQKNEHTGKDGKDLNVQPAIIKILDNGRDKSTEGGAE